MIEIWKTAKQSIKKQVPGHTYRMWIDGLQLVQAEGNEFVLGCNNSFSKTWITQHYEGVISGAIQSVSGMPVSVKFDIIGSTSGSKSGSTKKTASTKRTPKVPAAKQQLSLPNIHKPATQGQLFRKGFTFDQFVVGKSNEFAYNASLSVASGSRPDSNNLYIVSKTGLGKSHLSQAIGQKMLDIMPQQRIYYVTAENFANEMVQSLQKNQMNQFKEKYRKICDVFILEDIHFLAGKDHTQDELSYTLDSLMGFDKKIIFTSTYTPNEIPKLHDNLSSRLSSGLITQIESPDYETRFRILQRKAALNGLVLPEEVNHYLATELTKNVRQLESALIGVAARSSLMGESVNLKLAESILGNIQQQQQEITIDSVKKLVCKYYNVTGDDIISKSRKKAIVIPRQICMYLCRKYTDHSLGEIGKTFRRHHATAFHSVTAVEKKMKQNSNIKRQVSYLCDKIDRDFSE
ncbi:MAG: chromosomal replication initiator protein DnaA [Candidatus Magnetomorum sp.]|nr:chromosomal replication initiator protein DnaA [Candidatus Magnetomorum sp.]